MPQHYTRNTIAASFYCPTCGKDTLHRIDDRRRGPCLACIERLGEPKPSPAPAPPEQGQLFSRRSFIFLGALAAGAAITHKIKPPDYQPEYFICGTGEPGTLYWSVPAIPDQVWKDLKIMQERANVITGVTLDVNRTIIGQWADYYPIL